MKPQIVSQYVQSGKVKFEFRDYAFIGPESKLAAQGADCAANQGKFWEYHDTLYANQPKENSGKVTKGYLKTIASKLGLNTGDFNQCLDSGATAKQVQQDLDSAQQQKLPGTPTIFVNGQQLQSATWDSVRAAIEAELKKS